MEYDRIEIVSFPEPDHLVTIEGLKSYRVSNRRYRNRRIGDFLKALPLTEGRNTGLRKFWMHWRQMAHQSWNLRRMKIAVIL